MNFDLKENIKRLGLPLALVGVIVALLAWWGLTAEQLAGVAVSLVGLQLLIALLIDILNWAGVVNEGSAGKWSAVFNILTLAGVAIQLKFYPAFDIHAVDSQLFEFAKVLGLVFAYITQMIGTKRVHQVTETTKLGVALEAGA